MERLSHTPPASGRTLSEWGLLLRLVAAVLMEIEEKWERKRSIYEWKTTGRLWLL